MSTVKDLSQEILDEKNAKIIPANIKKNVKIFDVVGTLSGTDTTDATATADDIIAPKTAYVNGNKINGAITPVYATSGISNLATSGTMWTTYNYYILDYNMRYNVMLYYNSSTKITLTEYDSNYNLKKTLTLNLTSGGTLHRASLSNYYDPDYWYMLIIWSGGSSDPNYSQVVRINKQTGAVYQNNYGPLYRNTSFQSGNAGSSSCDYRLGKLIPHSSPDRMGWVLLDFIYFQGYYTDSQYIYTWDKGLTMNAFGLGLSWHSFGSEGYNSNNSNFTGYFTEDGLFSMFLKRYNTSTSAYYYYYQTVDLANNTYVNIMSKTNDSNYKHPINRNYYCDKTKVYKASALNTAVGDVTSSVTMNEDVKIISNKYMAMKSSNTLYIYELDGDDVKQIQTYSVSYSFRDFGCANDGVIYVVDTDGHSTDTSGKHAFKYITTSETENLLSIQRDGKVYADVSNLTAVEGNVLVGKTFSGVDGGVRTGTMPSNGSLTYTPSTSAQSIPAGYTSGGTVRAVTSSIDSNIQAENIKKDVEILGVIGTYYGPITQEDYDECNELADDIIGGASILPCTELEYIQNTGSQFIDLNYLPSTLSTKYEIGFMRTGIRGYYDPIINCEEDVRFGIVCTRGSDSIQDEGEFWIGSADSHISVTFPISSDVKYDIIADKTGLNLNGNFYAFSGTIVDANAQWSTLLNHRRKGATTFSNEYSIGKWYYLKIYENDNLIRDYIPALDLGGVACMYKKLGKEFYYNAGTGSFIAGPAKED